MLQGIEFVVGNRDVEYLVHSWEEATELFRTLGKYAFIEWNDPYEKSYTIVSYFDQKQIDRIVKRD